MRLDSCSDVKSRNWNPSTSVQSDLFARLHECYLGRLQFTRYPLQSISTRVNAPQCTKASIINHPPIWDDCSKLEHAATKNSRNCIFVRPQTGTELRMKKSFSYSGSCWNALPTYLRNACRMCVLHWAYACTKVTSTDATLMTCRRYFADLQRVQIKACIKTIARRREFVSRNQTKGKNSAVA